jgi:hypothetical protein
LNGSISGFTFAEKFFSGTSERFTANKSADLVIGYRSSSVSESIPISALHFGSILGILRNETYSLTFIGSSVNKTVFYHITEVGLLVSLPSSGYYSVLIESASGFRDSLCSNPKSGFMVGNGDTFVREGRPCGSIWPSSSPPPTDSHSSQSLIIGLSAGAGVVVVVVVVRFRKRRKVPTTSSDASSLLPDERLNLP